jgi:hypothetical protein
MKINILSIIICVLLSISFKVNSQDISPYLVGTNLWYTNPSTIVWDLTKKGGFQTIRIGGAEYDKNMPGNSTILTWVKQIRAIGAEPIVQVSQYKSAAVAASLVKYLNVDNKNTIAPVKFWNIGNEPWLQGNKPATSTMAAFVATYFKPIAAAMKEVDPTIKIYGPDECYYMDDAFATLFGSKGANDIGGKVPGKGYYYCDGISWHSYPQDANIDLAVQGLASFKTSIEKCKQRVDAANKALGRTGDNAIGWGIGEFNAKGGAENHTWGNGQMFGGIMGLCMKYGATYATTWSMYENGGNRTGTDFSMIDGAHMTPRASYRHMEFVAKYFKGEYVDGTSSNTDFVVFGAKDKDQVSVMIMHRGYGVPKEYKLTLDNTTPTGFPYALKVNADTAIVYSDIISERTTHVLIFRGDSIVKINYSSKDFDKEIAPQLSTVKISAQLPIPPSEFKVISTSFSSTNLSWNDNSDNEFGFIVEREISGVFKTIAMTTANTKSYTDSGLSPQTAYKYRVVAYNSLGKSDYSTVETVTTLETPAAKAYNGPHAIPGKIEAEDFDVNEEGISYHDLSDANEGGKYRTTGVDIESSTDTGGGFNVAYIESGEWLNYLVETVTPGTYDIGVRIASNVTSTQKIDVYIDNIKVGSVTPTNTAGWQNWVSKSIKNVVIKDSTSKLLKLKFTGADYNLNWIEFKPTLNSSIYQNELNDKLKTIYNKNTRQVNISSEGVIENATVQVYNSSGRSCLNVYYPDFSISEIDAANWPNGIYLITVSSNKVHYTSKLRVE